MSTSAGRGVEGWMVAFPIIGLIGASTMSAGDIGGMLLMLEGVARVKITSVVDFVWALL